MNKDELDLGQVVPILDGIANGKWLTNISREVKDILYDEDLINIDEKGVYLTKLGRDFLCHYRDQV